MILTPEQLERIEAGNAEIRRRREQSGYRVIAEKRSPQPLKRMQMTYGPGGYDELYEPTGEVNCARCERLGDFNAEHQRGWCMWQRFMVTTWHPVVCKAFEAVA